MCRIAFSPHVGICGIVAAGSCGCWVGVGWVGFNWTSSRPSFWVAAGAEGMLGMGMEKPRRVAARFLLGLVALRLSCACH